MQAGAGQVTVIGTRFDVRRDDDQTRVVVEAGTVKVQGQAAQPAVTLTAGLSTSIDRQGAVAAARPVNAQALLAWQTGKLVFNDASLAEVARKSRATAKNPCGSALPPASCA